VIDEERVGAILAETTLPTVFAEAVAAETGDDVEVVELFIGSLGEPGSGADTLIGMLLTNAERIASALGPVPS
jgi:ABC-type Zn uptake system ZnuABC Zn-binding protein ZnuA